MIRSSGEAGLWAGEVAARVRLLQSSLIDGEPVAWKHAVEEELDRALKQVALGKRGEYIEALDAEFPTFGPSGEEPAAPASRATGPLPDDPMALAERLVEMLPQAVEEREAVMNYLEQAGLVRIRAGEGGGYAGAEVPEELREWLTKLMGAKQPDMGRSLRLLNVMVDLASNIDQIVWQAWKRIAPKSVLRQETGRSNELRKMLGPYLSGDPEVSTEQIKQNVEKTRGLVLGLLASIGAGAAGYPASMLERLSPDTIRHLAQGKPGVFESVEKKCWHKYNEVFNEFSPAIMEKELFEAVRKYTEKLVFGAQAVKNLEE